MGLIYDNFGVRKNVAVLTPETAHLRQVRFQLFATKPIASRFDREVSSFAARGGPKYNLGDKKRLPKMR